MASDKLTTGADAADRTTYTTAPITPGADRLVVAFAVNVAAFVQAAPVPSLTGNGLSWTLVQSLASGDRRLSCFVARGAAPQTGSVTISCGNTQQTLCAWSIFSYDAAPGAATTVILGQAVDGPRVAATLSIPQDLGPHTVAVGGLMLDAGQVVTAGPGCTQIDVQSVTQPFAPAATLHTQDRTTPGTVAWTWPINAGATAIVLAVQLPTPVGPQPVDPVATLIRRFEPILHFQAGETTYPSDAKRYLEHSALWQAVKPYDTTTWSKIVPAGQLSGALGEPGKFIGDPVNSVDTPVDERFLELGGWRDRTGTPQAGVGTGTWPNAYANRDEIRSRYASDPDLRDSQFWYHAEYFDTTRLRRLAESVRKPDLFKIVAGPGEPALLCYYLFFPEHEQAVVGASFTAKEVGGYAGQWGCVALFLKRPGDQGEYTPHLIGFTGSPTVASIGEAADDEKRVTMKVAEWTPSKPMTTDGHPHLYVSRGSHSFYLDKAAHPVNPFPTAAPVDEGTSDGQYTEVLDNPDPLIFLIKALAGPVGWIAAGIELAQNGAVETGLSGTPDRVPDDTATAGGVTVHPANVAPRNDWTKPQGWRAAQAQVVNGRQYDFIVDRAAQPFWPHDNGRSGFRGRWGPRVEGDRLPRRAGMRFPDFWKLFLVAVADGRSRNLLPK